MFQDQRQRFSLGRVVATSNAAANLDELSVQIAIRRHALGDWGELDAHDRAENEAALQNDNRILSAYRDCRGTKFFIITEWDRSVTTILMPEDY